MANINDIYVSNSNFLKHSDLGGKKVKLKIETVTPEEIGQGDDKDYKLVVGFTGAEKRLVLNKTNASAIAAVAGDETDNWIGEEVIVFPTTTNFGGKQTPCIRIEMPMEEAAAGEVQI